jgi:hypothetical protein
VSSVVYFSVESFEARRKMVGNMAHYFLTAKADKKAWSDENGGLQKALKDADENRNKLAHYSVAEDVIRTIEHENGDVTIEFAAPRLRPYEGNLVSRMRGLTIDKPEHNLSVAEVSGYIRAGRRPWRLTRRRREVHRGARRRGSEPLTRRGSQAVLVWPF